MGDTEGLLDALDQFRDVRGTVALFDGLAVRDPNLVLNALVGVPEHPLAGRIAAWLRGRGVEPPPPPTAEELLARLGIGDVARWVQDQDRALQRLESRLRDVEGARQRAERAANGFAAVSVLLLAGAVLGWMAAFGVLPFSPEKGAVVPSSGDMPAEPR